MFYDCLFRVGDGREVHHGVALQKQIKIDLELLRPVSYTHLEVYKRQIFNRDEALQIALFIDNRKLFDSVVAQDLLCILEGGTDRRGDEAVSYTHLADVLDDVEVVRNEEERQSELLLQVVQQVDDLGLDGNVQC